MNITKYRNQLRDFIVQILDFLLLSKPFNFAVRKSSQECKDLLWSLEQPKTSLLSAMSRTVKITQEVNHFRFEICFKRYERGSGYNTAKASGIITSTTDDTETTVIQGKLRLSIVGLVPLGFFLCLSLFNLNNFSRDLGFYVLAFVISFFCIVCSVRDYHKLDALIHNTFSEGDMLKDGQS